MTTPTANNKLLTNITKTVNFGRPLPRLTVVEILSCRLHNLNNPYVLFSDDHAFFGWTYELICEEKKSLLDYTIASINKSLNNPHVLFSDDHSLQRKKDLL